MKHNLLKSVILSVILLLGVNSVWGAEIYLKPNSNWTQSNARFAAYFFGNGEKWVSMTCYRDFYSVEVPSGFTKVIFCRMNPSTTANNWNNKWNQSGDLTIPTNGNNLFTVPSGAWDGSTTTWSKHTPADQVVYLKPTDLWNKDGARFAAYAFNGCNNEWIDLDEIGCAGEYYTCTIPDKYHQVIFGRMTPNGTNGWTENTQIWNKSGDLTIDKGKCYTISSTGNGTGTAASGSWGTYSAPTYAITKNVGTGGTVTVSKTSNIAINEEVTVTVATSNGYTYKSGTITIGTNAATNLAIGTSTHTICGPTTINAQWTENKYNVTINTDGNGTTNQTGAKQVGIVGIDVTATPNLGYAFKQWKVTGGAQVADATSASTKITATAAGTVTAVFEEKPATTIYLEPTGFWNSDNPKYVAHVWNASGNTDIPMTAMGEAPHKYYTCEVPYGYTNVLFFRKSTDGNTIWNQTNNLTIPVDNKTLYEIKSIGDGTTTKATGEWKDAYLFYTVTLGSSMFGPFGISYNGQSYFSKDNKDETVEIPHGAAITFIEGQPYSDIYTGDIMEKDKVRKFDLTQPHTVLRDIKLESNYVTKVAQVAYLGVPNGCDWDKTTTAANANLTWRFDSYGSFSMTNSKDKAEFAFEEDGVNYYKFTIPAGCNKFQIQRKEARNDDENNTNYRFSHTCDHEYMVLNAGVNCYMLNEGTFNSNTHTGYWCALPAHTGDYRLLYVEQVVEKDADYTVITRTKAHPSDIIRKGTLIDTVSLHTYKDRKYMANAGGSRYESSNNPEIILQKYLGNDQWEDVECQMVYGPLETLPVMGQLPGRKNASPGSDIDDLKYHNGIEIIKQDVLNHPDKGNGVWNFVITQDGAGNASVQWDQTHRYTGEYYIRTDNAEGRWDQYTLNDNYMTYSQYAKDHSGFSHYFCKWVEVSKDDNTKFVIANDYGIAISDTLAQDAYTNEHGDIAHDANIRWSWNMVNNEIARAYIQGTWKAGSQERNRNLVVNYKSSSSAGAVEDLLDDSGDWIYQKDFPVKVGSHLNSLTATYPVTSDKTQTFASNLDMLTGDPANTNEYKVRILYDFKINKTLVALVPDNGKTADIAIDVIIERVDQGPATQVQAQVNATRAEGSTVYAVMSFTKNHINGGASKYAKQFYWISFPFDVRVSDVFGFGEYGKHWIIQWYDGEERAKNGCWVDSPTFWRFQTDTTDYVLEAGKGYVLTLDLAEMDVFTNTNQVSLYFPSRQTVSTVNGDIIHDLNQVTLAPYTCTIQRNDRWIKDSNWHMLGVPSYANKNKSFTQEKVAYFYQYNSENDTYTPTSSGSFNFNSMFSYMVQFAGTINWSQFTFAANGSQGLAAKRNTDNANDKHVLRLELQKNSSFVDQTFVQLQAEEATEMFDMNLDLTKMVNSGNNIYSLIPGTESNIEVAANAMPIAETIIPLGIVSAAAGEYTFAMPEGTDGITVELIDYETNTRTNMLLDEYTVNLGKGTFETRFALHVKPDKTATGVENITTPSHSDVRKFIIDGILYMQKDGALYDAQGHIVR